MNKEYREIKIKFIAAWLQQRLNPKDFTDDACLTWAEELYNLATM